MTAPRADVALITGTSSGMGMHAAVHLAQRGLHVIATMRDPRRADRLHAAAAEAGVALDVRALDVVDHAAATELVAAIEAQHGGIDVLVNNAGRGIVATAEQLTMEQVRDQLEVNYLAPVHLTKLVLPGMRQRRRGTILTVTSVGGAVGQPFAEACCGAKFAVEGFMQSLAVVAERFGVRVGVIEPAAVASDFVANVDRPERSGPYEPLLAAYLARSSNNFASAQSAADAGAAIADALLAETFRFRWQTSERATSFVSLSLHDTDGEGVLSATRQWIADGVV